MENLNEQVVNQETESTEPVSQEQEQTIEAQSSKPEPQSSESKYVPYDRFQELVHDRQEVEKRWRASEERYAQIERELQTLKAPKKEEHPLLSEMAKIDPRYADYLRGLEEKASKFSSFEQEFNNYKQSQTLDRYENSIKSLHESSKTPAEIREFVKAQLDVKAFRGQLDISKLDSEYKAIVDSYNKIFEAREREATKKYVQERKKDSALPPSQPKGTAASGKSGSKFEGSREELLASVARSAVTKAKAAADL